MDAIGFTKKYSSLSNTKEVNSLAEVTRIGDKEFTVVQHGQRWHNRLSCWIKDSVRSFFSPLRKSTSNEAWEQLGADLSGDESIEQNNKQLAQAKIERWQKKGVPLRILHVRQLLRQVDTDFGSQASGLPVKSTLFTPREFVVGHSARDGERLDLKIQDSTQTGGTEVQENEPLRADAGNVENSQIQDSTPPKPETPKLDAVAHEFVTNQRNWAAPSIFSAVVELLDRDGINTTANFWQTNASQKNPESHGLPPVVNAVMLGFFRIEKGEGTDKSSGMTTERFKENFEKAFNDEITSEKKDWFSKNLTDAGWDSSN